MFSRSFWATKDDKVCDKGPHQIFALSGVQQGHIQHHDVYAFFFGEYAPLDLNFFVVASKTVDAGKIKHIARVEMTKQPLILGALKVLAGLLVEIKARAGDS